MPYTTPIALVLSTLPSATPDVRQRLRDLFDKQLELLMTEVVAFLGQHPSPTTTFDFEHRIEACLRELGRQTLKTVYNDLEGDDPDALASHIRVDGEDYRINKKKTRQSVDTLFGPIHLWRHLYRPVYRHSGESAIAPLSLALGVVANATPALAEKVGRYLAESGATQRTVQERLRTDHGVSIGTGRLRHLATHLSGEMAQARERFQVEQLLAWLKQADESRGNRKPVLSVGRDGITLRDYPHGGFEVASAATVSVLDRAGKRLGTVYLAFTPEHGQGRMTDQLTRLIEAVLRSWKGLLPRLTYVTDAGDNETGYYERVLRPMRHPVTQEPLEWQRVVDFYHVMERVWAMAGALFGENTPEARGWARKMRQLLKKPNGPFRVLHSAAALRKRQSMSPTARKEFKKAYRYIQERTQWMQYHEYKNLHLPRGSGVTEAACKTIFTQRLKLSGMRWTKPGAQVVLDLRVVLLSGVWDQAYRHILTTYKYQLFRTPDRKPAHAELMAA